MPIAHELAFLAPIPRGHDVLLVTFALHTQSQTLVLDRTACHLYCPDQLWGPLHNSPALAVTDPIAVMTRFAWTVASTTTGVCAGALLSTKHLGEERHDVRTLLLLEKPGAPYR